MGTICGLGACPAAGRDGEVYASGMGIFEQLKQVEAKEQRRRSDICKAMKEYVAMYARRIK